LLGGWFPGCPGALERIHQDIFDVVKATDLHPFHDHGFEFWLMNFDRHRKLLSLDYQSRAEWRTGLLLKGDVAQSSPGTQKVTASFSMRRAVWVDHFGDGTVAGAFGSLVIDDPINLIALTAGPYLPSQARQGKMKWGPEDSFNAKYL